MAVCAADFFTALFFAIRSIFACRRAASRRETGSAAARTPAMAITTRNAERVVRFMSCSKCSRIPTQNCANDLDLRLSFAYSERQIHRAIGFPAPSPRSEGYDVLPLTKRQREILDYLQEFIQQHGYAPSLEEVGRRFGLSSLATVHKHLTNLEEKGCIRRLWNRSRSVELLSARTGQRAVELPMLGFVAAGLPIEAVTGSETIAVPEDLVGRRDTYVLKVKGDSMIDEQIRDGDYVIVEDRKTAENGEMVIALLGGSDVTLKKFYKENGRVRLQPANPAMQPMIVDPALVQLQGVVVGVMRKY